MNKSENRDATKLLKEREVVTSSELIRRLEVTGYRHPRKVLERSFRAKGIWRSKNIVLPTGARLFARHPFYGTAEFLAAIEPQLCASRPGLARILHAMDREQALDIDTVKKLLAVKLDSRGEGPVLERAVESVLEAGIGVIEDTGTARRRLVRARHHGTEEGKRLGFELYAEAETQRHLLALLMKHYKFQSLIAWNTPEPGQPRVYNNGQIFSAVAYSRLRPLRRLSDRTWKSCPVLFESLARPAELYDVEGFIERIHRAGDHKQARLRPLGVIGARSFSPEALKKGKDFGLAMVNFKELFGEAGLNVITNAQKLLASLTGATVDGKTTERLADQLASSIPALKNNPMVGNLCGVAFETFAVAVLRGWGIEDVRSGLDVPFVENGVDTTRDVDASGFKDDDIWYVVECKALRAGTSVDEEMIKKFYTETVPAFLKHVGKDNVQTCHAEIWTTGEASSKARAYLASLKLDRRIERRILTRTEIKVPKKISPLSRLMNLIAQL